MRIQYQILGFLLFLYSNNIKIENAVGKSKIPMLLHADRDPRTAMHVFFAAVVGRCLLLCALHESVNVSHDLEKHYRNTMYIKTGPERVSVFENDYRIPACSFSEKCFVECWCALS